MTLSIEPRRLRLRLRLRRVPFQLPIVTRAFVNIGLIAPGRICQEPRVCLVHTTQVFGAGTGRQVLRREGFTAIVLRGWQGSVFLLVCFGGERGGRGRGRGREVKGVVAEGKREKGTALESQESIGYQLKSPEVKGLYRGLDDNG